MSVPNTEKKPYLFGLQGLNTLTQGGIRRGEHLTVCARPNGYGTQMLLSMFAQILRHNTPQVFPSDTKGKANALFVQMKMPEADVMVRLQQYVSTQQGKSLKASEAVEQLYAHNLHEEGGVELSMAEQLQTQGLSPVILRLGPFDFKVENVLETLRQMSIEGEQVHVLVVDDTMSLGEQNDEGGYRLPDEALAEYAREHHIALITLVKFPSRIYRVPNKASRPTHVIQLDTARSPQHPTAPLLVSMSNLAQPEQLLFYKVDPTTGFIAEDALSETGYESVTLMHAS